MYHRAIEEREVAKLIQEETDAKYDYEQDYWDRREELYWNESYLLDYDDVYSFEPWKYEDHHDTYSCYDDYDYMAQYDDYDDWDNCDDWYNEPNIFSPGKYYNILGTDKNVFCVKYRDNDLFFDTKTGLEYTGPRYNTN